MRRECSTFPCRTRIGMLHKKSCECGDYDDNNVALARLVRASKTQPSVCFCFCFCRTFHESQSITAQSGLGCNGESRLRHRKVCALREVAMPGPRERLGRVLCRAIRSTGLYPMPKPCQYCKIPSIHYGMSTARLHSGVSLCASVCVGVSNVELLVGHMSLACRDVFSRCLHPAPQGPSRPTGKLKMKNENWETGR